MQGVAELVEAGLHLVPRQQRRLAFARVAMGYPLYIAAVGYAFLVVTRARRRVSAQTLAGPER